MKYMKLKRRKKLPIVDEKAIQHAQTFFKNTFLKPGPLCKKHYDNFVIFQLLKSKIVHSKR